MPFEFLKGAQVESSRVVTVDTSDVTDADPEEDVYPDAPGANEGEANVAVSGLVAVDDASDVAVSVVGDPDGNDAGGSAVTDNDAANAYVAGVGEATEVVDEDTDEEEEVVVREANEVTVYVTDDDGAPVDEEITVDTDGDEDVESGGVTVAVSARGY